MDTNGLALCCRYCYPPNSLHLCGPEKQNDLRWYTATYKTDKGTSEIVSQFTTLYPYLILIAGINGIKNPFHPKVVEAYWIGNELLSAVPHSHFIAHLEDAIKLNRLIPKKYRELIYQKITFGGLPHHSYHVLNIYKRTGQLLLNHTLETMEACLVGWGKIIAIFPSFLIVKTRRLNFVNERLMFGKMVERKIFFAEGKDRIKENIFINDWISYHWGKICQKLNQKQLYNLIYYTHLSLHLANVTP